MVNINQFIPKYIFNFFSFFQSQAYKRTTIANAALSYYFAPVFVTILSPVVLKEKLSLKKITCIGVSILGMFLIVGNTSDSIAGQSSLLGIAYGLTAEVFTHR